MDVCTIIAKNYMAHARVLAHSFAEHHPDGRFFVLMVDKPDGYLNPVSEPFEVLTPNDLACDEYDDMAARYDVVELSTAIKPWLLKHLLASGSRAITYLDPDIQIFASLARLEQLALEHKLVLTPHNTVPIPFDGERPTQIDIMIAGVFNLGYISLAAGPATEELLDWWSDRLRRDCRFDPEYGYFVDQRWMDLVPGLMPDYAVVRDPEFNVAYWNLHARELSQDGSSYTVDGRPLAFFHFSGFDPRQPDSLSCHQSRIKLEERPALRKLCLDYAAALDAHGYRFACTWPYDYGRLPDGAPFTTVLRRLFRKAEERGELHRTPFDDAGYEAFKVWLTGRDEDSPSGITRLLAEIYEERGELQRAFPDLAGANRLDYLRWAAENVAAQYDLPTQLLPPSEPAPAPPASPEPSREPPLGVNVVGYFRSELGLGEAGRQVVNALDAVDMPLLPLHGRVIPASRQGHPFTYLDHSDARYPINLICMNADELPEFAAYAGRRFFAGRYTVGFWWWEVMAIPPGDWKEAFELVDEVWVATHHVAQAISAVAPVPVVRIPLPVEVPAPQPGARGLFGFAPEEFVFLFAFDYLSIFERKNPLGVVQAFRRAFPPGSGARLVIKCINADRDPVHHARLHQAVADRADIQVIDRYLSPEQKNALTAACDCYVSLHRAEGFGLTMAEAMYLGKPVIATSYSGNLDFMTPRNSYLVDYQLIPIGDDASPYPPHGEWANPNVEQAAEFMREVFQDRAQARERGQRAAIDIRQSHSPLSAGQQMVARLRHAVTRAGTPDSGALSPEPVSLAELVDSVQRGPGPSQSSNLARSALRRSVMRIMRPFTAHQLLVNRQVLEGLQRLDRKLDATTERQASDQVRLDTGYVRLEAGYLREQRLRDNERRRINERADDTLTRLEAAEQRLGRLEDDSMRSLEAAEQRLGRLEGDTLRSLKAAEQRLGRLDAETHAIPFMDGAPFVTRRDPQAGIVLGYQTAECASGSREYRAFEDVFRGSEQLIQGRQRKYLPIIGRRRPVFDFGCGRGELLDLLRDAGIPYIGVDLDAGMIARCREKGHADVVHADGLVHLEQQPDGGLGVVFAAQVIEHLPVERLRRLLAVARRKLSPDGILIVETVNPHSIPALKTFWVDLSHKRPIFPEVALELCREAGFPSAYCFHPNGTGDVTRDRFVQGEFAVVASVNSVQLGLRSPAHEPD